MSDEDEEIVELAECFSRLSLEDEEFGRLADRFSHLSLEDVAR